MKRISLGRRFSMRICAAPLEASAEPRPAGLPRNFFSMASAPVASCDMSKRPSFVNLVISPADMQHSMASQSKRRAASAGCTARTWSSRNSMVAMTMSPCAMSAWQAASASASEPHSSAA